MNRGPWTVRAKRSVLILLAAGFCARLTAQQLRPPAEGSSQAVSIAHDQTSDGYKYNKQHNELNQRLADVVKNFPAEDYRLGPEDLLEVSVFEAPELNRTVRVSGGGKISMPLLGIVQTAGMTPRELEFVLEELLRRTYMKDPHVAVFVREMQSHPVSVFGAVKKPGVFQIRGAKTLVEVLSLAEGLAEDAGDTVTVMRRAGLAAVSEQIEDPSAMPLAVPVDTRARKPEAIAFPQRNENTEDGNAVQISLKNLLESGDQRYNVLIYPGDLVKVRRAGIVYVVGEVKKPGGFILKTNENITVLQALALAEGLTRTSSKSQARIIRTDETTGTRNEIPINLDKALGGKMPDQQLRPNDIVFVPNSTGRSALYRGVEAALSIAGGVIIYRR